MNTSTIKIIILSIAFLFSVVHSFGQTVRSIKAPQLSAKHLKLYQDAMKFTKKGKYKDAIKNYDKLLKEEPRFLEAKLRKAGLAFDGGEFDKGKSMFDEVIAVDPNYDSEMYYAAALCAKNKKDMASAVDYYKKYLKQSNNLSEATIKKINREIAEYEFRTEAMKNARQIEVKRVEDAINSSASEYLPYITLDNRQMIFTRQSLGKEDLYVSTKNQDGSWGKAALLNGKKAEFDEASLSMSEDGNTIVYVANERLTSFGGYDLYISNKENGEWSKPRNLGPKINTVAKETQPCIADNGKTIYFASNRQGGLGGNDIYKITKDKKNKWGEAVNLGPVINTTDNDESPFIHADGKTLFFRSKGHIGMGSDDIFYSKFDDKTKTWYTPVNLGYPINTENSEGALFIDRKGEYAYFASSMESRKRGKDSMDIYYFLLPSDLRPEPVNYIKVFVKDGKTSRPTNSSFTIIDLATNDTINTGYTQDGQLMTSIKKNKNYALHVKNQKYYFHSENFNTSEDYNIDKPFELVVKLRPIEEIPTAPIVLNNIFFNTGSSTLLPSSNYEIDNLVKFLNENKMLKIKIIGHTDNVGNDADNQKLSEERAKSVKEAIVSRGIEVSRVQSEGKGESNPIADNNTNEGRKLNRRTEFVVLK